MSALLGTRLNGRYRLEARIAAGGMATVYRAYDETLERDVAVKLMNREVTSNRMAHADPESARLEAEQDPRVSDQLERFRREARAVAQLSHPHIVGVIDTGEDDGRPYIVLEYVEGETLKDRIRRLGPLPVPEAVAYAIEIARALGAAHSRHIIHRDVKPQNVLIDAEGSAKVTDFGIARTLEEEGLTADGRVLGTTDYVSPEQALGHEVSAQSDLYSLGIVLYEMLTGEVPFRGETQVTVAMKHVRDQIPDVQLRRPDVSAALASVIDTATEKHPADRYADDAEMISDLEDALALEAQRTGHATGEATAVLRSLPPRTQRRVPLRLRHPLVMLALLAVTAAVVVIVLVFLAGNTHHGAGKLPQPTPKATTHQIVLCDSCARDYNPDATSGPKNQHPQLDQLAIDNDVNTAWTTEIYDNAQGQQSPPGVLGKPGVGIYVDARPGVAARAIRVDTVTPGYSVVIYGRAAGSGPPDPSSFDPGWVKIGSARYVHRRQDIELATRGVRYRYYLVWITSLGPHNQVAVNEIALYT
jgi:eukaryotic-like serine/threonine-protein kinase